MKKPLISIFACMLIFVGCDTNPDPLTINEESKSYCLFDEGTFWVYEDSATSQRDSVVVVSDPVKIWSRYKNHEGYEMKLHTYTQTDTLENFLVVMPEYLEWPEHEPSFTIAYFSPPWVLNTNSYEYVYYNYYNISIFFRAGYLGGNIQKDREYLAEDFYRSPCFTINNRIVSLRLLDSFNNYQGMNTSYNNVKLIGFNQYFSIEDSIKYETKSYWAKNIGLIRFEAETDSINIVTKLVNYNINN